MTQAGLDVLVIIGLLLLVFIADGVCAHVRHVRRERSRLVRRREQELFAEWWSWPAREPRGRA